MKGRTSFMLAFAWASVATAAIAMEMGFWDTVQATVVGGAILAVLGWIILCVRSAFEKISKDQIFSCCFVDHDPPGSTEQHRYTFYPLPIGESEHWLKITTAEGLNLTDINLRFISNEEAQRDPNDKTRPPEDITSVIHIQSVQMTPEIIGHGVKVTQTQDRHGGIDIKLDPSYTFGKHRDLFLLLKVAANETWTGKISFRGYDRDLESRYARTPVSVTDKATVQPIQKYPVQYMTVTKNGESILKKL